MLLAIDVGNSQTVFGLHDGVAWRGLFRRDTAEIVKSGRAAESASHREWTGGPGEEPTGSKSHRSSEGPAFEGCSHGTNHSSAAVPLSATGEGGELFSWLLERFASVDGAFNVDQALCVSVVPPAERALASLCEERFGLTLEFLRSGDDVGLEVLYDPPTSLGADRLANGLGALALYAPPLLVIDFGTATTFDAVSAAGAFVGGAIMPGLQLSADALFERAPRLPRIGLSPPAHATGRNTVEALQSGIVLGYAGAVETLAHRIATELGQPRIVATGGLGELFVGLCPSIEAYLPTLTLDGLLAAFSRPAMD